eukprot:7625990-Pyramimonas_sp.AAC.2
MPPVPAEPAAGPAPPDPAELAATPPPEAPAASPFTWLRAGPTAGASSHDFTVGRHAGEPAAGQPASSKARSSDGHLRLPQ